MNELEVEMGESTPLEKEPVCGMTVDERANQVVNHGVGYAWSGSRFAVRGLPGC